MNLRLLGAQTMRDVVPAMVDATNIHTHLVAVPPDQLYESNCTRFAEPVGTNIDFFSRSEHATCTSKGYQGEDETLAPTHNHIMYTLHLPVLES
jgi:hypothetical protein